MALESKPTRVAVVLPGLGRVQRGAETAFLEIASGLDAYHDINVTLFGSGQDVPAGLDFKSVACRPRERFEGWPKVPVFRTECHYEEFSFVWNLWRSGQFVAADFDLVLHCTYPFVNWFTQRAQRKNRQLKSLFVTQNGDWMCRAGNREYRYFGCDGLVTINPEYYENNCQQHSTVLIPNGTDPQMFFPGEEADDLDFGLPRNKTVVVMASALIGSKRVDQAVQAVSLLDDTYLVVAGDGPERERIAALAEARMPGRYQLLGSIPRSRMPALFRQADVFLHLSKIEPFGIVYLEAAASGLPIVTHDWETPRWILGDTGLFVDTEDPRRVAAAIQQAKSSNLGQAARDRVIADWTWAAQAAKYREFILQLLGRECEAGVNFDQLTNLEDQANAFHHHRELQHA